MQSGLIFDNYPMDRRDFLDGLADLEREVEAARDDVGDALDILIDGDEVAGKELETCIDSAESAHRHLDRIIRAIRKNIIRVKFNAH
jgi:hypothetical protein